MPERSMRAAVFVDDDPCLRIQEVERPVAAAGEAILRVGACGICGSDLHASQTKGMLEAGAIMGHELAGEIVELGPEPLGDWRTGDRVFSLADFTCGRCDQCRGGRSQFCERGSHLGQLIAGDLPGAFAEYVRASTNDLVRLPDGIDYGVASLLEPLCTAMVSIRLAELRAADRVLILGGGPIGLAIAQLCHLMGVMRIAVSEPNDRRRALAARLGATQLIDPAAPGGNADAITDELGAEPDVVFEAVGRPGMLNAAVEHVRRQGTVIAAGVCMEPDRFDHLAAYAKEPTIRIPAFYTIEDARYLVDMLTQGRLDPGSMLTHRVSLDELPSAFEALRKPSDQVKVVVEP